VKICYWVINVFNSSDFHQSQYLDDVRLETTSVNPDLRLNQIKSSVKSNPDQPMFTVFMFQPPFTAWPIPQRH